MSTPTRNMQLSRFIHPIYAAAALTAALQLTPGRASADDSGQDAPRHHHKPPAAAYDACRNEAAGDACEVTFHERHVEGTCMADHDGALFCRPPHRAREGHEPAPKGPNAPT
ncbi:MAG TPA: hypothetical protein VF331_11755 [Polyangiales bacterium]